MRAINFFLLLGLCYFSPLNAIAEPPETPAPTAPPVTQPPPDAAPKKSHSGAVESLLKQAKEQYDQNETEQAAALLERALRIEPRNSILWHNLAGVRLRQEDWQRAANLAAKSNTLAGDNKWLRVRNWIITAIACEGMKDQECVHEARVRSKALAVN
jgi:hypothetical protein